MLAVLLSALFLLAVTHAQPSEAQDPRAAARARMVAEIAAMARETGAETGRPRFGEAVMAAMGKGPRHRSAPARKATSANDNRRLPTAKAQPTPKPHTAALTTAPLDPNPPKPVPGREAGPGPQAA